MSKQTIEVAVPEGYEAIAYRQPKAGEMFLCESKNTPVGPLVRDWMSAYRVIVCKVEKWRPAELSDLSRGPIRARFRSSCKYWVEGTLAGYKTSGKWSSLLGDYTECEVLDG